MVGIKNRLSRLLNQNRKQLLLDFGGTRQIDITGLGILVDRIQKFRSLNGDVRLFNLRPAVFETLRSVGVDGLVETFPSEEEARRSFQIA
jgi:anti-anti-sigma factor